MMGRETALVKGTERTERMEDREVKKKRRRVN
jgi:hypothetical protein